jgi:Uma2 family endonuclease
MATVTATQATSPWTPPFPVYRFTVDQYHRMIKAGILTENDRVELLEGWIVPRMPHNPPHDGTIWAGQTVLLSRLPKEWILRVQSAITTQDSEPEPDLLIARGPGLRYFSAHPHPEDIGLVIEVADTTVSEDRIEKGRLYARAGIPIYWIVNLPEHQIEVYTEPKVGRSPRYCQRQDYQVPRSVPLVLAGAKIRQIAVRDLLP